MHKIIFLCIFLIAIGGSGWLVYKSCERKDMMELLPKFIFPLPTGPYGVGTKLFELTDPTHNDQETDKPRELVVQVWYPSSLRSNEEVASPTAPYPYEVREWYKKMLGSQGVSNDHLKLLDGIYTHAIPNAQAHQNKKFPMIIFAHGNAAPRGVYSFLCEELASHGYVVVMVMHTYVTFMTRFADGREITAIRSSNVSDVLETCVADIQYMLDQATGGKIEQLTRLCDFDAIGMVGHSLGGMVTAQVCRRDKRVKAGINLDGALWGINATQHFHKPFLLMLTPNFYNDMLGVLEIQKEALAAVGITRERFLGSNERFCRENGTDTKQIIIEGADHMSFMDEPLLQDVFAKITDAACDHSKLDAPILLKTPPILDVTKSCILAFFDRYLKKQNSSYPSVVQQKQGAESFTSYIPDINPKHVKINLDTTTLDTYVGRYKCGDTVMTVTRQEDTLWVQLSGQPKYAIYPETEVSFFYTVADRQLSFIKNASCNVVKLVTRQRGLSQEAERMK